MRLTISALLLLIPLLTRAADPIPKIILDTDMDSDCDDLGALAMLHAMADNGECEILATVVSSTNPFSAPCVEAINTFYGRADLPVGAPRKGPAKPSKYAKPIADAFAHKLATTDKAPEVMEVYRSILAKQPDQTVTIVTVGYLTNVANLIKLPAEGNQPSGLELIKSKVKVWVCMGGNFIGEPAKDDMKLGNNNFSYDKAAALYAVENWPGRLVFVGREIGSVPSGLKAGACLASLPEKNPIRAGYAHYFGGQPKDRHVADPTTVLYAVRGLRDYWDEHAKGQMKLNTDMTFTWQDDPAKQQSYLLKKKVKNDREIEKVIEGLMMRAPKSEKR